MPIDVSVQDYVDLTLELSGTLDPRVVMQRILEKSVSVADADRVTLSTLHEDGSVTVEAGVGWGDGVDWDQRTYDAQSVRNQPTVVEMLAARKTVLGETLSVGAAQPEDRDALARARYTAVVPILVEGNVVGMLVLSRYHDRSFKPQDVPTLTAFGALAGLALRNAKLYEDAADASRRLEAATYATAEAARAHELPALLDAIVRRSCDAAGADAGSVMHSEGGSAVIDATSGAAPVGARFPISDRISRAIDAGEVVQVATADETVAPEFQKYVEEYTYALVAPMRFAGELRGLLVLGRRTGRPAFTVKDIAALRPFSTLAAMVLYNARLIQQLRDAETAKREFMNIAVHEMRGPLTIIEGYTEMLLADTPESNADVVQQLSTIRRQAEHARGLAEDLLILARLESNQLGVRSDPVSVSMVVDDVVERMRPRAELRHGGISVAELDGVRVCGDRNLLERIVDNLVANAIDYSPDSPTVTVGATRNHGEVEIRVADLGIGVPSDERESIFAVFTRGSQAGRVKGSGLGLYLSRECARRMGGDIELEGAPREAGSSFVLRLPAA